MSKFLDTSGLGALRDWVLQKLGLKQDTLVSGTNIKTINSQSVLGSGDLSISGGLQNLVDGSARGSVRGIHAAAEDSSYTMEDDAFAEGYDTKASGRVSHAEGSITTASGDGSHAEGIRTTASGPSSHAEGERTVASNAYSHAEGYRTRASGRVSHAQNEFTIAAKNYQTAIGKYNLEDTETVEANQKAFIVGNGSDDNNRSNALTVDWLGNVDIASGAKYKINGTALSASDVDAQPTLVSGTNIKTVNSQSLLGSGNIDIDGGIFVATYGTTTYQELLSVISKRKVIIIRNVPNEDGGTGAAFTMLVNDDFGDGFNLRFTGNYDGDRYDVAVKESDNTWSVVSKDPI